MLIFWAFQSTMYCQCSSAEGYQGYTGSWTTWVYYSSRQGRTHIGGTTRYLNKRGSYPTYRIWTPSGRFGEDSLQSGHSQKAEAVLSLSISVNLIYGKGKLDQGYSCNYWRNCWSSWKKGSCGILWLAWWPRFCLYLELGNALVCLTLWWPISDHVWCQFPWDCLCPCVQEETQWPGCEHSRKPAPSTSKAYL